MRTTIGAHATVRFVAKKAGFVFRFLSISVLVVLLVVLAAAGAGWYWLDREVLSSLPQDLSKLRDWRPPTNCQIYDRHERLVDEFYLDRRIWIPMAELPVHVPLAFVAAEDRRFFTHPGVDLRGILRAMVTNLRGGTTKQGGSTITQQLVKNILVGNEKSYRRKLREAILAYRLERELGKDEILELYLNYIYLGSGNYGVEAAARDYFGISASQIDIGQAAMMAGLVPAPARYSPHRSVESALHRRELVLTAMVDNAFISAEEATQFADDPVVDSTRARGGQGANTSYATIVRREVRRLYGSTLPVEEGLQVHTPLDSHVQEVAVEAVRKAVRAVEQRQGRRGPSRRLAHDKWDAFLSRYRRDVGDKAPVPPRQGECFESLVRRSKDLGSLQAGPFTFSLAEEERGALIRVPIKRDDGKVTTSAKKLEAEITEGDVLPVCLVEGEKVKLDPRPWPEGAALVLENATGRVVALVGGFDVPLEGFVRAVQARRQPGSSFKPYVYASALLAGRTQLDTVIDAPLALPGAPGKIWSPKNYDGEYHGAIQIRNALAKSLNTVAVRLLLDTGVDRVVSTAKAMGITSNIRRDPTIALGSSEVSLLDQVVGYSTIARMGLPPEPVFIDKVEDVRGHLVGRAGERGEDERTRHIVLPGGSRPRALPSGIAYELADMMREVVSNGTAKKAYKEGFDRAGKTGTTNDFIDAWFVGFTPRYTIGVWVGTDGTTTLGDKETGGKTALPAWLEIAATLPEVEGERFAVPDDATFVPFDAAGKWVAVRRGDVPESVLPRYVSTDAPLPPVIGEVPIVVTATTAS
ncbi:MAG: PBP1A family penicillin-binding protein [Deltaproteobacteria bacterium]|nr:PBP1A family penicillin-binding protein [Deltaproteobacteria bacterium]